MNGLHLHRVLLSPFIKSDEMTDRKDGDEKGEYVNIQTNTDSIVNPGTIFKKKLLITKQKSRDYYRGPMSLSKWANGLPRNEFL